MAARLQISTIPAVQVNVVICLFRCRATPGKNIFHRESRHERRRQRTGNRGYRTVTHHFPGARKAETGPGATSGQAGTDLFFLCG
jgi:hypothetical protein